MDLFWGQEDGEADGRGKSTEIGAKVRGSVARLMQQVEYQAWWKGGQSGWRQHGSRAFGGL